MSDTDQAVCRKAEELIEQADHCVDEETLHSLLVQAYTLLAPLVERGFPEAVYLHACRTLSFERLDDEKHDQRHAELIKQAAEAGHMKAQFAFGQLLEDGDGVPKDLVASAQWFERSALQGYAYAQWVHGLNLLSGHGLQRDAALGLDFIRRAADAKFIGAMEFVADAYASGVHGYPKDEAAAQDWRTRSLQPGVMHY
jgi:TPR repeat protein